MSYAVRLAPEAEEQLTAIEQYIADAGSPATAARYVDGIVTCCESLATFPERGRNRDDIMPGPERDDRRRNRRRSESRGQIKA